MNSAAWHTKSDGITMLRLVRVYQQVVAGPAVSLTDPFPVVIDATALLRWPRP